MNLFLSLFRRTKTESEVNEMTGEYKRETDIVDINVA